MKLPVNREALARRNQLDERDELVQAAGETPETRLRIALALSDLARHLATAANSASLTGGIADLEQKASLYARPLRLMEKKP